MSRTDPRNPANGAPATQGMDVLLIHRDGACWSPVELGGEFTGYPRLSTAPARLRLVKRGGGPISHGDTIRITTTEPLLAAAGKRVLGTWKSPSLYYWKDLEGDNQDFRIHRTAGPGPVAYGDEIYLVNVHYNQRIGRKEEEIYLTSGEELTDTFTLADPATPPLVTSFNPLDQLHRQGTQNHVGTLGWVWHKTGPSQEMLSVETSLPAGRYHALVQLAPGGRKGRHCATISVQTGGGEIASRRVDTEAYTRGDWQRALVPFTTASRAVVKIAVTAADNGEELDTGAVSITPAGQRPFYVIGHMCNTVEKAYNAVKAGANAIEIDITPVLKDGKISFDVFHGPTVIDPFPDPRIPFARYVSGIIENGVANRVALLQFDIKPESGINNYDYGFRLAQEAKQLGIGVERAFFSVEDPAAARDFYRGVKDAGMFNGACEASINGIVTSPDSRTDPSIWYNVGRRRADATFLGVGIDSHVITSPMRAWLEPVSYTTVMRDRHQLLKKAYYWTLDSPESMRKMLDLNVDGIIVNDPARLVAVLREQPYAQMFRLATVNDSPNTVHGWSALSGPRAAGGGAPRRRP